MVQSAILAVLLFASTSHGPDVALCAVRVADQVTTNASPLGHIFTERDGTLEEIAKGQILAGPRFISSKEIAWIERRASTNELISYDLSRNHLVRQIPLPRGRIVRLEVYGTDGLVAVFYGNNDRLDQQYSRVIVQKHSKRIAEFTKVRDLCIDAAKCQVDVLREVYGGATLYSYIKDMAQPRFSLHIPGARNIIRGADGKLVAFCIDSGIGPSLRSQMGPGSVLTHLPLTPYQGSDMDFSWGDLDSPYANVLKIDRSSGRLLFEGTHWQSDGGHVETYAIDIKKAKLVPLWSGELIGSNSARPVLLRKVYPRVVRRKTVGVLFEQAHAGQPEKSLTPQSLDVKDADALTRSVMP